jgi:hypothetical protein
MNKVFTFLIGIAPEERVILMRLIMECVFSMSNGVYRLIFSVG